MDEYVSVSVKSSYKDFTFSVTSMTDFPDLDFVKVYFSDDNKTVLRKRFRLPEDFKFSDSFEMNLPSTNLLTSWDEKDGQTSIRDLPSHFNCDVRDLQGFANAMNYSLMLMRKSRKYHRK
jgi:hypothetical protein